jgi:hypothetical protein
VSNVPDAAVSCYALQGQFVAIDPRPGTRAWMGPYQCTPDSKEPLVPTMTTVGLGEDSMTQWQGDMLDSSDV